MDQFMCFLPDEQEGHLYCLITETDPPVAPPEVQLAFSVFQLLQGDDRGISSNICTPTTPINRPSPQ